MTHNSQRGRHLRPFVYETHKSKTLHFSICDVQSTMHLADPERLVVPYTRLMMGFLLFAPEPKRIVMVGLGGGSLAKFCHRHLPHACVEVVEINPHVIALRREFAIPEDGVRFQVRMEDAADYMRTSQTRCDVILADGFDANGVPANLCSRSFYDNCFDLLTPGGVLVANLHGHHEHCPVYLERLRKSFAGRVLIVPEPDSTNIIAFAFRDMPRHLDAGELTGLERLSSEVEEQLAQSFVQIERAIEKMSQVRSLHLVE